jgi:hypothetical protein
VRLCGRCPVLSATVTTSTSIRRCDCRAAYGSRSIASSGAPATLARGKLRKKSPRQAERRRGSVGGKGEAPHTTLARRIAAYRVDGGVPATLTLRRGPGPLPRAAIIVTCARPTGEACDGQ